MTFEGHFEDNFLSKLFVFITYLFKLEGSVLFRKFDVEVTFGSILEDLSILFDGPQGTLAESFLIEIHWCYVYFRFLPNVQKHDVPVDDDFEPLDAALGSTRLADKQAPTGRYNPRIARA